MPRREGVRGGAGGRLPSAVALLALGLLALRGLAAGQLRLRSFVASPGVTAPRPRAGVARRAEDEEAAPAAAEAGAEAEEAAAAPESEPEQLQPLFQELIVSNRTTSKSLMRAMVAIFNTGSRAADLVLIDPRCKSTLVYALGLLPDQFRSGAQLLIRRRDRRMRVRVIQKFGYVEGADPEVLTVGKNSNVTKLGNLLKSKFVDVLGNNRDRTVRLRFAGKDTASMAILAVENAARISYRELTFSCRFEEEMVPVKAAEPEGLNPGESAPPPPAEAEMRKQVSIVMTVSTT